MYRRGAHVQISRDDFSHTKLCALSSALVFGLEEKLRLVCLSIKLDESCPDCFKENNKSDDLEMNELKSLHVCSLGLDISIFLFRL